MAKKSSPDNSHQQQGGGTRGTRSGSHEPTSMRGSRATRRVRV
jgi:hypothetical protein